MSGTYAAVQKHPRYPLEVPVDVVTPAAEVQQLALVDISLGGVFIRTARPPPPGSALRLRIRTGEAAASLGLTGRVVHILDEDEARRKAHPPGMGVQFEGISEQTRAQLQRLVDGLVEAARRERARRGAVRFAPPAAIVVSPERGAVAALWEQGLKHGGVFVECPQGPPFGARVGVSIGPLTLKADVVHIDAGRGFGVQVLDLDEKKREALLRFAQGTAEHIAVEEVRVVGPPLGKVLAAARRLFTGIDEGDLFGGAGLPDTAGADEVKVRVAGLVRLFSTRRPDATPPQQARIEAASRAAAKLEPLLLARVAALRKEAELAPAQLDESDRVRELVAEAQRLMAKEPASARRVLLSALEIAPDDDDVMRRLAALNETMDFARAVDLVKSADVFVQGVGMRAEAVQRAREAARLTRRREVRLLAVRVLAKAGEPDDAALLAEELVDADPRDALGWQALLAVNERREDWRGAARAGEALLRLKPGDPALKKRVAKAVERARRG